jgi:hypothetical protein
LTSLRRHACRATLLSEGTLEEDIMPTLADLPNMAVALLVVLLFML